VRCSKAEAPHPASNATLLIDIGAGQGGAQMRELLRGLRAQAASKPPARRRGVPSHVGGDPALSPRDSEFEAALCDGGRNTLLLPG